MSSNYNFTESGVVYSFDDVFIPADRFRDNALWTWGGGGRGQLGTNNTNSRNTPVTTFAGGTNWKQVSSGGRYAAAIKTDGTLWVWGSERSGRLGTFTTDRNIVTPVTTFAGGTNWKQVSCGYWFTAAIKTDGTLWTWGLGGNGPLGTNDETDRSTPVTTFAGGTNWKQVSSGNSHTSAIKTDGTLWTWGDNNFGKLGRFTNNSNRSTPVTTFAGGTNWADTATTDPEDLYTLSSGDEHTAAIKTDGTLWTWGLGSSGQLGTNDTITRFTPVTTFAGGSSWKQVSSGYRHTAAIKTDGTLWTWGYGTDGRLGTNDIITRSTPVTTFAGGTNWKQVSAGNAHTAAIKTDGTLWTWGYGGSGRLGTNDLTNRSTPVTTFAGGTDWKQVSSGINHTAAIKTDGTLWTWGYGGSGVLGTNDETNRSTPVTTFAGGTNWKQVSSGDVHTAAIKTDGTLWTWGFGGQGRLGTNDSTNRNTPVTTFAGGTDWKQVSSGINHTAAIKTDGTLWTWGSGTSGRLGTNDVTSRSTPVTTFAGGTNWKQVSSGGDHTVALQDDGVNKELFIFGSAYGGTLGINLDDDIEGADVPAKVSGNSNDWKQVSSGNQHTAAIKTDGTLWTWGTGTNGRLGTNDTTFRNTPVTTFAGGTDWKQVSSGGDHTAAIKTDGTLWTWGLGTSGQLGKLSRFYQESLTPVTTFAGGTNWADTATTEPEDLYTLSSGDEHTAAIKTDGTLWTWGRGTSGRLGTNAIGQRDTPVTTFAGGSSWKQVSSGGYFTTAIKTDGTLWTWGGGGRGQLGTNNTNSRNTPVTTFAGGTNWKQVSSGGRYAAAIKTDGTLWTWGLGTYGRLGTNDVTDRSTPVTTFAGGTNWKQVSCGYWFTAAIKTDGTLWTWGLGTSGPLGTNDQITRSTPVTTFAGGTNWKQVSSGDDHTAAIKTDGTLWTWGRGTSGRLGTNAIGQRLTPVTTFAGGTDWKQVSSGGDHTAAIKTDGTLWTWGSGTSGRLGTNDIITRSTPVTTFAGGTDWKQVSSGGDHTVALQDDGVNKELYVFGNNNVSQLGIFEIYPIELDYVPTTIFAGGSSWKQVSAGDEHTAAIKTDGTLWTWGRGNFGQLGTNNTINRFTPVTTFAGGSSWKQVSSGGYFTTAIQYPDNPVL